MAFEFYKRRVCPLSQYLNTPVYGATREPLFCLPSNLTECGHSGNASGPPYSVADHYFAPAGLRSIVVSVPVFVCSSFLFVCMSAVMSQKTHVQISRNFLYKFTLPVSVARSSCWRQCNTLCTYGFVDDAMFSQRMGRIRDDANVSSSSPDGGTRAKSAISDYILFSLAVLQRRFERCRYSSKIMGLDTPRRASSMAQ